MSRIPRNNGGVRGGMAIALVMSFHGTPEQGHTTMTGIGGLGAIAPIGGGISGINGGLNGPLSQLGGAGMSGATTVSMRQLSELVAGFTSAEILMALMIAAASQKQGRDNDQSGALALLAGMALASQLNGVAGLGGCPSSIGFNAGDIGGVLNVVA